MARVWLIYLSLAGPLGSALVSTAAVSTAVQLSLQLAAFGSFEHIPVYLLGSYGNSLLIF